MSLPTDCPIPSATFSSPPFLSPVSSSLSPFAHPQSFSSTRIFLIRHGRSTFNDQHRYQGCTDEAVLSPQGWQQAHCIGQFLKTYCGTSRIDAIYTSPLQRVQQTVQGILTEFQPGYTIPQHRCEPLREIHLPAWEGRSYAAVKEQDADAYHCWMQHPDEFSMEWEPIEREQATPCPPLTHSSPTVPSTKITTYPVLDLYQRAQGFWQNILRYHPGQTLVIASHSGTNRALISTALGLSPRYHHRLQQSNGGITLLDYCPIRSAFQLQAMNWTHHLGETLPKLKASKEGVRLLLLPTAPGWALPETLIHRLRDVPIAYSVTQVDRTSESVTQQILQSRSEVMQLRVHPQHFVLQWPRSLEQLHRHQSHSIAGLTTGLAIAPADTLKPLITATIRLPPEAQDSITLIPGTLTVLHYPAGDHPPVLQALNFE